MHLLMLTFFKGLNLIHKYDHDNENYKGHYLIQIPA